MTGDSIPLYVTSYVAFLDVLGFGDLVERSAQDDAGESLVERIYYAVKSVKKNLVELGDHFQFTQFSDSFF